MQGDDAMEGTQMTESASGDTSRSRSPTPDGPPEADPEVMEEYNRLIADQLHLALEDGLSALTAEAIDARGDNGRDAAFARDGVRDGSKGGVSVAPESKEKAAEDLEDDGRPMTKAEKQNAKKRRRKERERMEREAIAKAKEHVGVDPSTGGRVAEDIVSFRLFSNRSLDSVSLSIPKEEYPLPLNPRHLPLPPDVIHKIHLLAQDAALHGTVISPLPKAGRTQHHSDKLRTLRLISLTGSKTLPACAVVDIAQHNEFSQMETKRRPANGQAGSDIIHHLELAELPDGRLPRKKRGRKHARPPIASSN